MDISNALVILALILAILAAVPVHPRMIYLLHVAVVLLAIGVALISGAIKT